MKNLIILVALILSMQAISQDTQTTIPMVTKSFPGADTKWETLYRLPKDFDLKTLELPDGYTIEAVPTGMETEVLESLENIEREKVINSIQGIQKWMCEAITEGDAKVGISFNIKGEAFIVSVGGGASIELMFKCKAGVLLVTK